jgi:glycosyltransferase involved in cell wall biosynthesis
MKVLILIRDLEAGGAQRQTVLLSRALAAQGVNVVVATFYPVGRLGEELEGVRNIRLVFLGKRGRWDVARFGRRLLSTVREAAPDVVIGYMQVANFLSLLAGRWAGCRVVWNVRCTNVPVGYYGLPAMAALWLEKVFSRLAEAIIVNSEAGRAYFASRGFFSKRLFVIRNGIDTERFFRTPDGRAAVRRELGVVEAEPLVGLVARLDPMKDHESFLQAAAAIAADRPEIRFLCVGGGDDARSARLRRLAGDLGLGRKVFWIGDRRDMSAVYCALDVLVLASAFGEGVPNVVGEAMACEVPCVVTDVGDSARLVGDTGLVVPVRDPVLLAGAIAEALAWGEAGRAEAGRRARKRIEEEFSVARLVRETMAVLDKVIGEPA